MFSTASPLITAVSLVFFAFSFLVWRHHVLFVFVRSYESGASMFPHLFSRIINSLFMYQAFMSAYLLIKQAYTQAFVLWILGKSFPITTHRLPDCPYKTDTFFFTIRAFWVRRHTAVQHGSPSRVPKLRPHSGRVR